MQHNQKKKNNLFLSYYISERQATIRLYQQATKKAQHHPRYQAPTKVPDCLYSRGAHKQQHKKRVKIRSNNN